jgi:hypothetical protein
MIAAGGLCTPSHGITISLTIPTPQITHLPTQSHGDKDAWQTDETNLMRPFHHSNEAYEHSALLHPWQEYCQFLES